MPLRAWLFAATVLALGGCSGAGDAGQSADDRTEPAPRRETVFDPMTSTIGRAQGVQQTVDEQAAEQRRRIADAER